MKWHHFSDPGFVARQLYLISGSRYIDEFIGEIDGFFLRVNLNEIKFGSKVHGLSYEKMHVYNNNEMPHTWILNLRIFIIPIVLYLLYVLKEYRVRKIPHLL